MLVPAVGSCVSVMLPKFSGPSILRVVGWSASLPGLPVVPGSPSFRLRCSVVLGPSSRGSGPSLGRGPSSVLQAGALLIPLGRVRRVLPSSPFISGAARAALRSPLCRRVAPPANYPFDLCLSL